MILGPHGSTVLASIVGRSATKYISTGQVFMTRMLPAGQGAGVDDRSASWKLPISFLLVAVVDRGLSEEPAGGHWFF